MIQMQIVIRHIETRVFTILLSAHRTFPQTSKNKCITCKFGHNAHYFDIFGCKIYTRLISPQNVVKTSRNWVQCWQTTVQKQNGWHISMHWMNETITNLIIYCRWRQVEDISRTYL